jgi:hypothetical protein
MLRKEPLVRFVLTPLAVAVLLVFAATAFAQGDTGKISGTVKDQNGAIATPRRMTTDFFPSPSSEHRAIG